MRGEKSCRTSRLRTDSIPRLSITLGFLLLFFFTTSCSSNSPETAPREITVAAAANLTNAFSEIGKEFTARTGIHVTFSYGGTAELAKQIENGAPFDVFASADVQHVDTLDARNLLTPGSKQLYARGRLVLWIPPDSKLAINKIEDLARPEVERVALAKPDIAPYGRAAVEALRTLNLWSQIEPKAIFGQNVSQAKQYASTGNADVAFIPASLARPNEGIVINVDEALHQPIDQAIAVVKDSKSKEAAQQFVDFVLSADGQAILVRHGYQRP